MRVVSWNVNGLRAAIRKGFWDWLGESSPDVLCMQETRLSLDQRTDRMANPEGYRTYWNPAERKGYSGVATYCRTEPSQVLRGLSAPEFDVEGRVLTTQFQDFVLVNTYVPSGQRGHDRVEFKLRFTDLLRQHCIRIRQSGMSVVVCGDLNTAHQPIDLARPKQNVKTSGFLPEEREALGRWFDSGFVDIFRHLHPERTAYSWWTYRANARARNIGWRIDYFLVSDDLVGKVVGAEILGEVMGSDHCPVELQMSF